MKFEDCKTTGRHWILWADRDEKVYARPFEIKNDYSPRLFCPRCGTLDHDGYAGYTTDCIPCDDENWISLDTRTIMEGRVDIMVKLEMENHIFETPYQGCFDISNKYEIPACVIAWRFMSKSENKGYNKGVTT